MQQILTEAARIGHAQLCVQAFADRRPERHVWDSTHWEWAVLRPENGTFDAPPTPMSMPARSGSTRPRSNHRPCSPAPRAGSLYWLGLRDHTGAYLDGANTYTLSVPQPVPARLFWSLTVYDAETRSEIATDQNQAALRSMFELADVDQDKPVELWFGPHAPNDEAAKRRWIKTIPGTGWFAYFRIYGPEGPAFDGTWQLSDFQALG